jgi:peptidoglycan lytic transglycosylase F
MSETGARRRPVASSAGLALALLAGHHACREPPEPGPLDGRTEIVVLTRNSPTTYYEDRLGRWVGFEYELATAFARSVDLRVRFEVLDSVDEILTAVAEGRGDIAAAGLTRTPSRAERFVTGPSYQTVEERVVCHPGARVVKPPDLVGKSLRIISASSYDESLAELRLQVPDLLWTTSTDESTEQLLQEVGDGRLDCTVADSNILALDRRYLPPLDTPFALGAEKPLAWFIADRSRSLLEPLEKWLAAFRRSGRLQALVEKYYAHVEEFDYYDTAVFLHRIDERLPEYRPFFVEASQATDLPWALLAALAYQESHWDPAAVSRTGVQGIMMLTLDTAASLGVSDRLDPRESILAGARYLAQLIEQVPPFIPEPDRQWMALAAYNVGFSHLQDARTLAIDLGRNPNSWTGVKAVLPYLSERRFHQRLRHGYARGQEPVAFVEQVRNYHDLLVERVEPGAIPAARQAAQRG